MPKPRELLKCCMPFDEAMRRVLRVKPPTSWKKAKPAQKRAR